MSLADEFRAYKTQRTARAGGSLPTAPEGASLAQQYRTYKARKQIGQERLRMAAEPDPRIEAIHPVREAVTGMVKSTPSVLAGAARGVGSGVLHGVAGLQRALGGLYGRTAPEGELPVEKLAATVAGADAEPGAAGRASRPYRAGVGVGETVGSFATAPVTFPVSVASSVIKEASEALGIGPEHPFKKEVFNFIAGLIPPVGAWQERRAVLQNPKLSADEKEAALEDWWATKAPGLAGGSVGIPGLGMLVRSRTKQYRARRDAARQEAAQALRDRPVESVPPGVPAEVPPQPGRDIPTPAAPEGTAQTAATVDALNREVRALQPEAATTATAPTQTERRARPRVHEGDDYTAYIMRRADGSLTVGDRISAMLNEHRGGETIEEFRASSHDFDKNLWAAEARALEIQRQETSGQKPADPPAPGAAPPAATESPRLPPLKLAGPSVQIRPAPQPMATGKETALPTPAGNYKARYEVVAAEDLIPSHDAVSFGKKAEYPAELQERPYHRDQAEQMKVIDHADKFDPRFLVTTNPDASNGPPVLATDSNVVLGGNSRTMTLQRVAKGKARDNAMVDYQAELISQAESFGLDGNAITAMLKAGKTPVLVRRLADVKAADVPAATEAGRRFNLSFTQAVEPVAAAVSRAKNLTPEASQAIGDVLAAAGEDVSLREALGKPATQRGIMDVLQREGIIPPTEANRYVTASTGLLNEAGVDLVEKTLAGTIIPDADLLSSAPRAQIAKVVKALPAIVAARAQGAEWDISADLTEAMRWNAKAEARGIPVEELWDGRQMSFLEQEPAPSAQVQQMAIALRDMKPTEFVAAARAVAADAALAPSGQGVLELVERPTPQRSVAEAFGARGDRVAEGASAYQRPKRYSPDLTDQQLKLSFYDDAETRPDTTEAQRAAGIAAARALFERDRRAGGTLLGSALWKDFTEGKGADLVGQKASTPQELALLAQVLRDPRFETLRFFFLKGDEIVAHSGFSSRMPGTASFLKSRRVARLKDKTVRDYIPGSEPYRQMERATELDVGRRDKELSEMMQRAGADGYYIVHNHPGGNSLPSSNDRGFTRSLSARLPGFKAHVVIDDREYSVLTTGRDAQGREGLRADERLTLNVPKRDETPEIPHDALGRTVLNPNHIAALAKEITRPEGYSSLVGVNSQGRVQALAEVPDAILKQGLRAGVRVRHFGKHSGSRRVFVISADRKVIAAMAPFVKQGIVDDAIPASGGPGLRSLGLEPDTPSGDTEPYRAITSFRTDAPRAPYGPAGKGGPLDEARRVVAADLRRAAKPAPKGPRLSPRARAQAAITSEFTPLRIVEEALKGGRQEHDLARKFELVAGAKGKAEADVIEFRREVVDPVRSNADDLNVYLFLKRTIDRLTHDPDARRVGDWSIAKAEAALGELRAAMGPEVYGRLEKAGEAFQRHTERALRLQVDSGRMSPETYKAIREANDFYAPFRVLKYLEETDATAGTGRRIATTADLTRAITGIGDEDFQIGDILQAAAQQIVRSRVLAEKNRAMLALDEVAALDTKGEWFRRPTNGYITPGREAIRYFKNGEEQVLETSAELARAVQGLNPGEAGLAVKAMGQAAVPLRWGATSANMAFQLVNLLFADAPRLALISRYGIRNPVDALRFPLDFAYGLFTSMAGNFGKPNELYMKWLRSGAANSTVQRELMPGVFRQTLRIPEKTSARLAARRAQATIESIAKFGNAIEEASKITGLMRGHRIERIAALPAASRRAALERLATEIRNYAGSPDFLRRGHAGRDLNLLFMFFNARVQGAASDFARLAGRTGGTEAMAAWTRLSAAVGVPALVLALINESDEYREDYERVPAKEREDYFMIPRESFFVDEDGTRVRDYWRIPKREIVKLFSNMIESAVRFARGSDPEALEKFAGQFVTNVLPVNISGANLSERGESVIASMNPLLKVPAEYAMGRDTYRHRDTVPMELQHASPPLQYRETTPQVYRTLGQLTNQPPVKLQQLVSGATAGLITQFTPPKVPEGRSWMAENPVLRRFVRSNMVNDEAEMAAFREGLRRQADERILGKRAAAAEADRIGKLPAGERGRAMADVMVSDPRLGRRLKETMDDRAAGVTAWDRRIRMLGVENGERAAFFDAVLRHRDPADHERLMNEWTRKGLLSSKVRAQLYLLQQSKPMEKQKQVAAQ